MVASALASSLVLSWPLPFWSTWAKAWDKGEVEPDDPAAPPEAPPPTRAFSISCRLSWPSPLLSRALIRDEAVGVVDPVAAPAAAGVVGWDW